MTLVSRAGDVGQRDIFQAGTPGFTEIPDELQPYFLNKTQRMQTELYLR